MVDTLPSEFLFTVGAISFLLLLILWDNYRTKAEHNVIDAHRRGREQGREEARREQTDTSLEKHRRDADFRRILHNAGIVDLDDDAAFDRWKHRWIEHAHGDPGGGGDPLDVESDGERPPN